MDRLTLGDPPDLPSSVSISSRGPGGLAPDLDSAIAQFLDGEGVKEAEGQEDDENDHVDEELVS